MSRIEAIREAIARKLIVIAIKADPGNGMLCQDGKYKLEIGWRQPRVSDAFKHAPLLNFIAQGNDLNGDTGL